MTPSKIDEQRTLPAAITARVRALYEAYPYPHYPLLATPHWQDGYQAHAQFAATLAGSGPLTGCPTLIGGGGEMLPYIIRKWEPERQDVISVDLSAHSIRRAKWRGLLGLKKTQFVQGDFADYLTRQAPGTFQHIDAYGVIHHMPNPSQVLALMASRLRPGGTLRLMVYNGEARSWIHHLQRLFADELLAIDRFAPQDLALARAVLQAAASAAPALTLRLQQLGAGTLGNDARFADTFLHPREVRYGVAQWLARIDAAGLHRLGLFDRYAELDDLPNPFSRMPTVDELSARARDGRFENNLELFMQRPAEHTGAMSGAQRRASTWRLRLKAPPQAWFNYRETTGLHLGWRIAVWQAHLAWVLRGDQAPSARLIDNLATAALQRLLRIGAVLPGQIADAGRRSALQAPMAAHMQAPTLPARVALDDTAVARLVAERLARLGRASPRFLTQALRRLGAAQGR